MTEQVFIVPYDKTENIPNGYIHQKHDKKIWNQFSSIGRYIDKDVADKNIVMQQIVPNTIIKSNNNRYLCMTLKHKDDIIMSIGFGDNIIPIDGTLQPLFNGTTRTLMSDVILEDIRPLRFVGTVRDKAKLPNYIGYNFIIENVEEESTKLANNKLIMSWLTKDELIDRYGKLDTWSKHIVNYLVDNDL